MTLPKPTSLSLPFPLLWLSTLMAWLIFASPSAHSHGGDGIDHSQAYSDQLPSSLGDADGTFSGSATTSFQSGSTDSYSSNSYSATPSSGGSLGTATTHSPGTATEGPRNVPTMKDLRAQQQGRAALNPRSNKSVEVYVRGMNQDVDTWNEFLKTLD